MTIIEVRYIEEKMNNGLLHINNAIETQERDNSANVLDKIKAASHEFYLILQAVKDEKKYKLQIEGD